MALMLLFTSCSSPAYQSPLLSDNKDVSRISMYNENTIKVTYKDGSTDLITDINSAPRVTKEKLEENLDITFFENKDDKKTAAVYYGIKKQPFKGAMLSSYFIYFDDLSFIQIADLGEYAFTEFSKGTYLLTDEGGFPNQKTNEDGIVLRRTHKLLNQDSGLETYDSMHCYKFGTMNYIPLFFKLAL